MRTMIRKNLTGMLSGLFEKQINYLLKHSSMNFLGNIFLASIIVTAFYQDTTNRSLLLAWFGSTVLISLTRLYFNKQLKAEKRHTEEKLKSWANSHILFTTVLSLLWGIAGFILFPEQLIYQVLLIVAISCTLITSITTLAASKSVFYLQIALLLLPISTRLAVVDDNNYKILAVMIIVMGIMMSFVAQYVYKLLYELHITQQKAEAQAHTDQITQLANRRYFDKHFKEEWRRAARTQCPISLLMIDVDHFKLYNDNNGHQAGDQCLKELAMSMKSIARRQGDIVARHGGEEFAILLHNTSANDAKNLAEKLRQKIIDLDIPHKSPSSLLNVVTVSIGVASCIPRSQKNEETGEDILYPAMLIGAADRAMYQAKEHGRNRVVVNSCESKAIPIPLHKNQG